MASGKPLDRARPDPRSGRAVEDDDLWTRYRRPRYGLFGREDACGPERRPGPRRQRGRHRRSRCREEQPAEGRGSAGAAPGTTGAVGHSDAVRPRTAVRGAGRAGRPVSRGSGRATCRGRSDARLAVALQRAEPDGVEVDALAVPLAVRGLLTQLCESEPVALIIDDLQWLDQASVGSLGFALRRIYVDSRRLSVLVGIETRSGRRRPT